MIDGSVLRTAQKCFEKKSRVVVKMVVKAMLFGSKRLTNCKTPGARVRKVPALKAFLQILHSVSQIYK